MICKRKERAEIPKCAGQLNVIVLSQINCLKIHFKKFVSKWQVTGLYAVKIGDIFF
jgi:hypothetical protein